MADGDVDWTELFSAVAEISSVGDVPAAGALIVDGCRDALGAMSTAVWLSDGVSAPQLVASHGSPPEPPDRWRPESERSEADPCGGPQRQTLESAGEAVFVQRAAAPGEGLVVTHSVEFAPGQHLGVAQMGALEGLFDAAAKRMLRVIGNHPVDRLGSSPGRVCEPETESTTADEVRERFAPAADGSSVGGDWSDIVTAPDGRTVLVVGDVVGHGLGAAVEMSELRVGLRRLLLDGSSPATALARLNDLTVDRDGFATCCCVEIGPRGATVTSAGHPLPIVTDTSDDAIVCAVEPGPPLGAVAGSAYSSEPIDVGPGNTIVLYSDGLVEQPGATIDDGIRRVRRAAAHAATAELDALADHLLGLAGPRNMLRDDVTVLVYRPATPAPRARTMRTHPGRKDHR